MNKENLMLNPTEIRYNDLDEHDKAKLKSNSITNTIFNQRMRMGWELYDAINLPNTFRNVNGEILQELKVNDTTYRLYPHHYFKMQFYKLTNKDIGKRIENGATVEQATSAIKDGSIYDKGKVVKKKKPKGKTYAQLLFEQSCRQFLEAK